MKNIIKQLMIITVGVLTIFSCEYDDNEFEKLTNHAPDPNAGFFVQFDNNVIDKQLTVDENSNAINITETMEVELLGMPQSEAITVTISADPSSTMTSDMYTLSTTSVIIPAGKASATFTITTVADNMPQCEFVTLKLNLSAGDNTTGSEPGKTASFRTRKISPSPLENGLSDLEGSWGIEQSYTNGDYYDEPSFNATWDGTNLIVPGFGQPMIVDFWGEPVVSGGTTTMTVSEDGTITIPRQYIFTTVYPPPSGPNYDYEIEGSGSWVSLCGEPPVIKLKYDIYYPGDECGLACTYSSYFGASEFGGVYVLK